MQKVKEILEVSKYERYRNMTRKECPKTIHQNTVKLGYNEWCYIELLVITNNFFGLS